MNKNINDKDKSNNDSEPMGTLGWVLAILGLIVVVISIYVKIKVSGLFGFKL